MKFVIDMNLSPEWRGVLAAEGWDALHWSEVGDPRATDAEIMRWDGAEDRVVLTHDLDFGALLAATQAIKPSVVQVRTQDIRPEALSRLLLRVLHQHQGDLTSGAVLVVDPARHRIRLLPLTPRP